MNTLILNANDLMAVLSDRRYAIVELLAHTSALSKQLSGLIHDNEQELAPTLDKLNAVTAVLENNRDNIAKALPGLAKFQTTLGETIGNGPYYQAYVPNIVLRRTPTAVLRLRLRLPPGCQRRPAAGQCRPPRRTSVPVQRNSPDRRAVGSAATMTRNRLVKLVLAAVLVAALVGGVAVVIRQTLFRPTTSPPTSPPPPRSIPATRSASPG